MRHWRIFLGVGIIAAALGVGIVVFQKPRNAVEQGTASPLISAAPATGQPPVTASPETVTSLLSISGERILFAKREVMSVADDGTASYRTTFLITDPAAEKLLPSWTTDDLPPTLFLPFADDSVLLLDAFGEKAPKRVSLSGEERSGAVNPALALPTDYAFTDSLLAYLRYPADADGTSEVGAPPEIVIRPASGEERVFSGKTIGGEDAAAYPYLFLRGFAPDGDRLFVQAAGDVDLLATPPYRLVALDTKTGSVTELLRDTGLDDEGNIREVLGFTPVFDAFYVNTADPTQEKVRTSIERYAIAEKRWETIYENAAGDFVTPRMSLLAPDGTKLALQRSEDFDGGITVLDLSSRSVTTLVDKGEFLAWVSSTRLLYETYTATEDQWSQVAWHVVDLATGKDVELFRQETLESGPGFEKVGDVSYVFVGVFPSKEE